MNELDVQIHQDDKDPFIKNFNGEDTQFKYADIYTEKVYKDLVNICSELSKNCDKVIPSKEFLSNIIFAINTTLCCKNNELEEDEYGEEEPHNVRDRGRNYPGQIIQDDDYVTFIVKRNILDFADTQCPFCKTGDKISYKKFIDENTILVTCNNCNKTRMVNIDFKDSMNNYISEENYNEEINKKED